MRERILKRPEREESHEDLGDVLREIFISPTAKEAAEKYHELTPEPRTKYKRRRHGSTHPKKEIHKVRPAQPIFRRK